MCHLAHPFGQQQQRPHKLVAQRDGKQHGAEHCQEQGQRERPEVHALEPVAGQRTLLVLAVSVLHCQRIGGDAGRHDLDKLQVPGFAAQVDGGRGI